MYSAEQRMKAVETFARFGCSAADTIAELGYPTRHTLRNWWREYQIGGDGFLERKRREPKYSDEEKRGAVDYYLEHGRSLARTTRAMGYPSRETLGSWIDELAPGQRRRRGPNPEKGVLPIETKVQAVAELEARGGSAAEVADRYGVSRTAPYAWRREILGHNGGAPEEKGAPVSKRYDGLPNDVEELKKMQSDLKAQVRKLQLEIDVRQATLEILKKDPGTDPKRLTNAEKAAVISSLRPKWKLKDLLALTRMRWVLPFQLFNMVIEVMSGTLRGLGYSFVPTILCAVFVCGLRILWVAFVFPLMPTFQGLLLVYPASWLAAGAAVTVAYWALKRKLLTEKPPQAPVVP